LSPTNKRGDGHREYAEKRRELMDGPAHLLEVDLIRVGTRFPTAGPAPSVPYFVFLSRAGRRQAVETWPVPLEHPLPPVPVPLLPGDADVLLDLQAALDNVHDFYRYADLLDYTQPPPGPLSPEQLTWIDQRLRAAGRRP
jgi:hypothetical protein